MRFAVVIVVLAASGVAANTEIHRCLQDDGTIAFQETPCPEPSADENDDGEAAEDQGVDDPPDANDDVSDFVNPFDEPAAAPPTAEPVLPEPVSRDRAECEQTTRDAIDAIDLEMREQPYTEEQGEAYLDELLALTQQLRACKQL